MMKLVYERKHYDIMDSIMKINIAKVILCGQLKPEDMKKDYYEDVLKINIADRLMDENDSINDVKASFWMTMALTVPFIGS